MIDTTHAKPKTALVFGGSRGIGAATVAHLAAEGFDVAFTYVSREDKAKEVVQAAEQSGGRLFAIQADSTQVEQIRTAVTQAVADLGSLDVVVVSAGLLRMNPIETVTLEELDDSLAVNVRGVFLSIQATVPHLAPNARIITVGSNVAQRSGHAGSSVYQMTKAAVAAMVRGVARDLAPQGITVNNVQPGPIDTDMNAGHTEALAQIIPLNRVGQPEEIAGFITYLATTAPGYLTGASLTIDGGINL